MARFGPCIQRRSPGDQCFCHSTVAHQNGQMKCSVPEVCPSLDICVTIEQECRDLQMPCLCSDVKGCVTRCCWRMYICTTGYKMTSNFSRTLLRRKRKWGKTKISLSIDVCAKLEKLQGNIHLSLL